MPTNLYRCSNTLSTEKARLQAEAKAAEDARKQADAEAAAEAAAEARRKRDLEREAARQALTQVNELVLIFLKYVRLLVCSGFYWSIYWHLCRWKRLLK